MKQVIFVIFIILLSVMWVSSSMYAKIPRRESEVLRILYNATDGKKWKIRKNWEGTPGTENTWHGITCNKENNTVLEIELIDNNLTGTLPADLGDLSNLEKLILIGNQLKAIHRNLGKLSNLTTLNLASNQLTGKIPSWIGNLKNLTTLDLSNNQLNGPIPSWIRSLKNLTVLNLSNNQLTGGIPPWIGELENLEELLLDGNRLGGPIPQKVGNLSKLTILKLSHNKLKGDIPSTLHQLTNLANSQSNFKWNALYTRSASLRAFLNEKQEGRDWESTQTTAPKRIRAIPLSSTSIKIRWEPIAYKGDSGGYRVFYSSRKGKPYEDKLLKIVEDKAASEVKVTGLKEDTTYYFVVQTRTDAHTSNPKNTVYSEYSKEVFDTTHGFTIAGYVKTPEGQGLKEVKITVSPKGKIVTTDNRGYYILKVKPGWTGTVTPSKIGYDFSPSNYSYSNVNSGQLDQDYKAGADKIISGRVTHKGKGVADVTLSFSYEKGTFTVTTDPEGIYSYTVSYFWAGTVTPSRTGHKFEPGSREYKPGISDTKDQDYRAILPEISGQVKNRKGKGINNVTLTFSNRGGTTVTDSKGNYSNSVLNNWSGRVRPAKTGYKFYPTKRYYKDVTLGTKKKTGDYKAELDRKLFIAVTGNQIIPSEGSFDDVYGKSLFSPEIKAGYKIYRDFYVWAGYSFSSKNGKSYDFFKEPAKWEEKFLSLGLVYFGNLSISFGWKAELGVIYVSFTEEMSQIEKGEVVNKFSESGNALGLRIDGAGIFKFSDRLFTELSLGYLFASDTINEIDIKLGGLRAGIGLGLRF